jgi:hypothetical protein
MTHLWLLVKMLVPRSGRKLNVKWHGMGSRWSTGSFASMLLALHWRRA